MLNKPKVMKVECACCGGSFLRRRHSIHCLIADQLIYFNRSHQKRYHKNNKIKVILSETEAKNKKLMSYVKAYVVSELRFD